jgi:uncharacterized protein (TIGR03118 family)
VRAALLAALLIVGVSGAAAIAAAHRARPSGYAIHPLVSDERPRAPGHDRFLVNSWGMAASPTGPWWTANEASDTSTLYSAAGRKQLLTVHVDGGPTGVVFYGGKGFRVQAGRAADPARFIYACEDGMIRAWTPTVPGPWSEHAEVVVDEAGEAAVFRGIAITHDRVYATDFHNARVAVYDSRWRRIRRPGAFTDPAIPDWYAPFGIQAVGNRVYVSYVWRAPVNGNDAPTGGYVDEFDLAGRLTARVAHRGALNAPWGMARAPASFGTLGGALLIGNFGDGHINAYRRSGGRWRHVGALRDEHGRRLVVNGLWGLAFGNGGMAGRRDELFFTSGPHEWRGVTELGVHGLLGSITPA